MNRNKIKFVIILHNYTKILDKNNFEIKDELELKIEDEVIKDEDIVINYGVIKDEGFNNFDIVYYINLEHRKDRLSSIINELNKTNIDKEKINRIKADYIKKCGSLGCTLSHINTLKQFLKTSDDIRNCLILEDDFVFVRKQPVVNMLINNFFKEIGDNYDILLLCSNILSSTNVTETIIKINNSQTTAGYVVNKRYAKKLLDNYENGYMLLKSNPKIESFRIDQYMKLLQKKDKWYALNPIIAKQKPSFSDIEKKNVFYNV